MLRHPRQGFVRSEYFVFVGHTRASECCENTTNTNKYSPVREQTSYCNTTLTMSEHSISPSAERPKFNQDTVSSLPRTRNPYRVNMTGGIMKHQESCTTVMTANSSDNGESFAEEDSRKNVEKSELREIRKKEREAQMRLQNVFKHSDVGDDSIDPEASINQVNSSTNSTLDCSCDTVDELKGRKKGPLAGYDRSNYICGLAAVLVIVAIVAAIPVVIFTAMSSKSSSSSAALVVDSPAPTISLSPSVSPSRSQAPSHEPSSSYFPSDLPSTMPSMAPTDTYRPSQRPSNTPTRSLSPSNRPSNSMVPSYTPSTVPTNTQAPSSSPSESPSSSPSTSRPSSEPSISLEPTFTPIDPNWRFKLRLHWHESYYWQEETEERFWCLECVKCEEYGRVSTLGVCIWCTSIIHHGCDARGQN